MVCTEANVMLAMRLPAGIEPRRVELAGKSGRAFRQL